MELLLLYITAKNREEAHAIARALLEERLVACASISAPVDSLYWWQGSMVESNEAVLVAKTTQSKLAAVTARVKALHSYDCPCIVALPIVGGNPEFLQWVTSETTG